MNIAQIDKSRVLSAPTLSRREERIKAVDAAYGAFPANGQYAVITQELENLRGLARRTYERTTVNGKQERVTRSRDRINFAAHRARNLGTIVKQYYESGLIGKEDAYAALDQARDILKTSFTESLHQKDKLGVGKKHLQPTQYDTENPFTVLRTARGQLSKFISNGKENITSKEYEFIKKIDTKRTPFITPSLELALRERSNREESLLIFFLDYSPVTLPHYDAVPSRQQNLLPEFSDSTRNAILSSNGHVKTEPHASKDIPASVTDLVTLPSLSNQTEVYQFNTYGAAIEQSPASMYSSNLHSIKEVIHQQPLKPVAVSSQDLKKSDSEKQYTITPINYINKEVAKIDHEKIEREKMGPRIERESFWASGRRLTPSYESPNQRWSRSSRIKLGKYNWKRALTTAWVVGLFGWLGVEGMRVYNKRQKESTPIPIHEQVSIEQIPLNQVMGSPYRLSTADKVKSNF